MNKSSDETSSGPAVPFAVSAFLGVYLATWGIHGPDGLKVLGLATAVVFLIATVAAIATGVPMRWGSIGAWWVRCGLVVGGVFAISYWYLGQM